MTYPVFASGDVLNASDMNAVGLWLVKTQTIGTAVSSVTVTGAFSADYDNYKITAVGGTQSTGGNIALTLGSAATGYYYSMLYVDYAAPAAASPLRAQNVASFAYAGSGNQGLSVDVDLQNPFATTRTNLRALVAQNKTDGFAAFQNGFLNDATSYTAFTLTISSGTMTGGTVRVYGYRN